MLQFLKSLFGGNKKPGTGIMFAYQFETGKVYVASRLIDSPAGRASVPNQVEVVSIDGHRMMFPSRDLFLKYFKEIYVNLKSFTFVFTENSTSKSVILSKELVQSNIPVYWDPNGLCPDTAEDKRIIENVYLRTRVCWCHVTGQYYSVLDVTMLGLKTIFL